MEWKVTFKFGVYHIHIGDEWTLDNDLSYTIEPTAAERIKDKLNDLQSQLAAAHARVAALEAENVRLQQLLADVRTSCTTAIRTTLTDHHVTQAFVDIRSLTEDSYVRDEYRTQFTVTPQRTTTPEPEAEPRKRKPIQSWNFEVGIRDILDAYDGRQLAGDEGLHIVESKYGVDKARDDIEHFTESYYDKWHYARSAGYLTTDKRPQLTQDGTDLLRSMRERDELNASADE